MGDFVHIDATVGSRLGVVAVPALEGETGHDFIIFSNFLPTQPLVGLAFTQIPTAVNEVTRLPAQS